MTGNTETEWVRVNRHLQRYGTATCSASNLLLLADEAREKGLDHFAHALAGAARDVIRHRAMARRLSAALAKAPRRSRRKVKP